MNGFSKIATTALAALAQVGAAAIKYIRRRTVLSASLDPKDQVAGFAPPTQACNDNQGADSRPTEGYDVTHPCVDSETGYCHRVSPAYGCTTSVWCSARNKWQETFCTFS